MMNIGTPELILILVLALIFFGPKKLPEIGRALGLGLQELRKASRELASAIKLDEDLDAEQVNSNERQETAGKG